MWASRWRQKRRHLNLVQVIPEDHHAVIVSHDHVAGVDLDPSDCDGHLRRNDNAKAHRTPQNEKTHDVQIEGGIMADVKKGLISTPLSVTGTYEKKISARATSHPKNRSWNNVKDEAHAEVKME